jgi:translation initiation factor IF-3
MSINVKNIRRNAAIRARDVRVIDPEGKQLGVMSTSDALRLSMQYGCDLIEIAPNAQPPVCRIMDFGKFKYELSKKEKEQSKTTTKLKEVKFRVRIEQNDYMTKLRHAESFLLEGHKLKVVLSFRNRELAHPQLGMDVIMRALNDLNHVGTPDSQPRQAGRAINVMMSPLPQTKRKPKYTKEGDAPLGDEIESPEDSAEDRD